MPSATTRVYLNRLANKRAQSSPRDEDFATAESLSFGSFDPVSDEALASTELMAEYTTQQTLPQQVPHTFNHKQRDNATQSTAQMSIEQNRGAKKPARKPDEELDAAFTFKLGGDSLYELTATPPLKHFKTRSPARKADDVAKTQTSLKRNTPTSKTGEAIKHSSHIQQPTLSEALKQIAREEHASQMAQNTAQLTATFHARNTRFSRSRQVSTNAPTRSTAGQIQQQTPRKMGDDYPTGQSNSFALPSLPNITELVSGVRKNGTPVFNKDIKSRSRFTAGGYKPTEHHPVGDVPVPEEDKAIYASLHLLKDRVEQLEMEKSEAQKRTEEYESEIIDLRSQLTVIQHRPDSALGSDEDVSGELKWQGQKESFQASIQALQDRLDRSERKVSVSDIAVKRITKEREQLATQLGVAYFTLEELKVENSELKDNNMYLQGEYEELKEQLDALRRENNDLRFLMAQTQTSHDEDTQQREKKRAEVLDKLRMMVQAEKQEADANRGVVPPKVPNPVVQDQVIKGRKEGATAIPPRKAHRPKSADAIDESLTRRLAAVMAKELQPSYEAASTGGPSLARERSAGRDQSTRSRSRSKSAPLRQQASAERKATLPSFNVTAPTQTEGSDAESTTQLDFTQKSVIINRQAAQPKAAHPPTIAPREDDLTLLSYQDPNEILSLRKKLEDELRAGKLSSTTRPSFGQDDTLQQLRNDLRSGKLRSNLLQEMEEKYAKQPLPRKSSMKDVTNVTNVTNTVDEGTGRFSMTSEKLEDFSRVVKSVRVQSPHTSDESINAPPQTDQDDTSMLSNTSRRRRRAESVEGMTSAFILPDITLNGTSGKLGDSMAAALHERTNCTSCPPANKKVEIPDPIPVTDRDDIDATNATIRPSQPPTVALATVIKQLEDEITHLKIKLQSQQRLYNKHDAAISKRRRQDVKTLMDRFTTEIEKRSDQVYALYDVLEGQKQAAAQAKKRGRGKVAEEMTQEELDETLSSLGIDPLEYSGHIGRADGEETEALGEGPRGAWYL